MGILALFLLSNHQLMDDLTNVLKNVPVIICLPLPWHAKHLSEPVPQPPPEQAL